MTVETSEVRAFSWGVVNREDLVWKLARLIGWRAILVQPAGGSVSI